MAEQMENAKSALEDETPEDEYDGDLGDAASSKGAGIIGFDVPE